MRTRYNDKLGDGDNNKDVHRYRDRNIYIVKGIDKGRDTDRDKTRTKIESYTYAKTRTRAKT